MHVLSTAAQVRAALAPLRRAGRTVALVPTMGALHPGHLSLVRLARECADVVVVSIFVNPLQFGPGEDLTAYPRDLDGDLAQLDPAGVHLVFAPGAGAFTPPDRHTVVTVTGLSTVLEGASRPGHLDGVTTVVAKLLGVVQPDFAVFGEKDYQQLVVLRTMVADLDLGVELLAAPLVREPDGLALSSRNAYLSARERRQALALSAALAEVRVTWDGDADRARSLLASRLRSAPGVRPDYAEVVDPETLAPLHGIVTGPARALVAAGVGRTRLIDNVGLQTSTATQAHVGALTIRTVTTPTPERRP